MKLSVLILSIPERLRLLECLLDNLHKQISDDLKNEVEILVLIDNKIRSIAQKRNNLLQLANGDYVCFLDDDDSVNQQFIPQVLKATIKNPDCVTFKQRCSINGKRLNVTFGLGNPHGELSLNEKGHYKDILRPPYHMCAFRRKLAQKVHFKDVFSQNGQSIEDFDWLKRLYPTLNTEIHLPVYLHYYNYDSTTTASVRREQ